MLEGRRPLVRYINGEVVTASQNGKLTILNTNLDTVKTFNGSKRMVRSLTGNEKYISFGADDNAVRYYNRADGVEKVR